MSKGLNPGGFGYCTHTWNPMLGCAREKISRGCANCWGERMAVRQRYRNKLIRGKNWSGNVLLLRDRLKAPIERKKPAVIAVNFMGDMFHGIDHSMKKMVWDTMFIARQHTFLILTKRPEAMLDFCNCMIRKNRNPFYSNVWFGASASDQKDFDRIIEPMAELKRLSIKQRDVANTWLSLEPLLEPIEPAGIGDCIIGYCGEGGQVIDQVIVGGESGPGARPMAEVWASDIICTCRGLNIPVYMKQMAGRAEIPEYLNIKQLAWRMP